MTLLAHEQVFNGSLTVSSTYDPDKITITGNHIAQTSLGTNAEDKFLGPKQTKVIRAVELSGWSPTAMHVLNRDGVHQIFSGDAASAATTRRVALYTYNLTTEDAGYLGFITLQFPAPTASHTIRGLRASLQAYNEGTVAVSGTTVTGTGTSWQTDGVCVGNRIGFGNADANEITTWYEITAISDEDELTLNASPGTLSAGTPYVIEDLRLYVATTASVLTSGGVFVVKGLRLDMFGAAGTTIPAATTVDNIRAVYWLKDDATVTNTVADGLTYHQFVDWDEEYIYVINGTAAALSIYRYNVRAPLTLTSGAHVLSGSDIVKTGTQTLTGTVATINNGRIATTNHGPGQGVPCIYFSSSTRVYRVALSDVVDGSTAFVSDQMIEIPYGGTSSILATSVLSVAEYTSTLDKFIFSGYSSGANGRIYLTEYNASGDQFENHFGTPSIQYNSSAANNPIFPSLFGSAQLWIEDGVLYWTIYGTTVTTTGVIYVLPGFGAHWTYADLTGSKAILPAINLTGTPARFHRLASNCTQMMKTLPRLTKQPEPYRFYYRTAGISDNSGSWTLLPDTGDLSGVDPASQIQFAVEFHMYGDFCIPSRLHSISLIYEEMEALPPEFKWNLGDSNVVTATFGFIQTNLLASWPTDFRIRIYRADTDVLVLDQVSDGTLLGQFEYWNGTAWVAGVGTNTVDLRRRFVPSNSLPGGVPVYALLSLE